MHSLSWKGNTRTQDPQSCSHLCPLMIGQRLSRPNHGCLCHDTHTQIFSMTFYCGECTTQTSPDAFVGHRCDALLLRQWMDGCHAEVRAVLSPLHHSALTAGATGNFGQHYYFQTTALLPKSFCIKIFFIAFFTFTAFHWFTFRSRINCSVFVLYQIPCWKTWEHKRNCTLYCTVYIHYKLMNP